MNVMCRLERNDSGWHEVEKKKGRKEVERKMEVEVEVERKRARKDIVGKAEVDRELNRN